MKRLIGRSKLKAQKEVTCTRSRIAIDVRSMGRIRGLGHGIYYIYIYSNDRRKKGDW